MTKHLGLAVWVAGAMVGAAAGACSNSSDEPSGPPSSATSTQTPTASSSGPSPSATSATDQAAAASDALVRRYFAVLDGVRQKPRSPLAVLSTVATGTQLAAQKKLIQRERQQQLRQIGSTGVSELTVQSVNLDNSDPAAGKVPTVIVDACWDVSDADLVDNAGRSVVSSGRADTGWTRYTVANYQWSENPSGGWRIASSQDLKQTPCAAS